jgi:signal transduction histidine kinase
MATILIVDDDITTQLILQNALEEEGHQVTAVGDGKTAIALAEKLSPELMICDWMLPGMDGLAVCEQIRARPAIAPIFFILLTAQEKMDEHPAASASVVDEWMTKPIEIDGLLARVRCGLKIYHLNRRLWRAETQLFYSEKMSGLGQMVSGIAHELNNPVSFVSGNVNHAADYARDLIELVQLYGEHYPEPDEEIRDQIEDIDLEFLLEDFPQLIDSIEAGTDRIRQIVQSLRNFYKDGETDLKTVDIRAGIEDILPILQARFKGKKGRPIEVVKEFGELPEVECYPGPLNQVWMNLLSNAIDSLDICRERDPNFDPEIRIQTESETDPEKPWIAIRICDNGDGIPPEVRDRIFEPLFTTKPPGIGTGMGLSISRQIVTTNHRGTLEVDSEPGKGATFTVKIPRRQTPPED